MQIERALYDSFEGQLESRVHAFVLALEAHRLTVGVPAPVEHQLVEALARSGVAFEIIEPPEPPAPPDPIPDPEPEPFPPLSPLKFYRWLLRYKGVTEADVLAAVALLSDPLRREEARLEASRALEFRRDHPLVTQIGEIFDMTSEDIDAAWAVAAVL